MQHYQVTSTSDQWFFSVWRTDRQTDTQMNTAKTIPALPAWLAFRYRWIFWEGV